MKLTNAEIASTVGALNKLTGMKWPVTTSLEIVKLAGKLQVPLSEMGIVRQGLVRTYGITVEKDGMGTTIKSDIKGKEAENVLKYMAEVGKLGEIVTEVKVGKKIKLPRKVEGKPLQIEPSILIALEKFIEVA